MPVETFIFDLGNVLIDWDPAHLFRPYFGDEERLRFFLEHVCPLEWHGHQDAGRAIAEAVEERVKEFPDWEAPIRAYYGRWREMFRGPITGTVDLLEALKRQGFRLFALSNWNAGLFPQTVDDYPFLQWFDGILLSSDAGTRKPDPRIYARLLEQYGIDPASAVFIDDREENVRAAEGLGIRGIVFQNPEQLKQEIFPLLS